MLDEVQQNSIRTSLNKEMHLVSLGAKLKLKHFEQVHRRFTRIEMLDFATPGGPHR